METSTRHATSPPRRAAAACLATLAVACAGAVVLSGCATTGTPDATWASPELGVKPLQGARVLVVCEAAETVLQQLCQDRMAEELTARGLSPVRAAGATPAVGRGAEAYLGAARTANAQALLLTSVAPDTLQALPPRQSPFSIGIGGFGGFGGRSGVGVGVSVPIGGGGTGYTATPGYAVNSSFTDARSGRLLWSGRDSTGGGDLNAGMGSTARTLMGAAEKAGVF